LFAYLEGAGVLQPDADDGLAADVVRVTLTPKRLAAAQEVRLAAGGRGDSLEHGVDVVRGAQGRRHNRVPELRERNRVHRELAEQAHEVLAVVNHLTRGVVVRCGGTCDLGL